MSQMFRICSPGAYEFSGTNRRSERVRGNILQPSTANGLTRPKWSQLRFFSGVDLAPPYQAPPPCRLLQPTMPYGSRKRASSGGEVVPPPCATPYRVLWRAARAICRRPRKGSRGNGSVNPNIALFYENILLTPQLAKTPNFVRSDLTAEVGGIRKLGIDKGLDTEPGS